MENDPTEFDHDRELNEEGETSQPHEGTDTLAIPVRDEFVEFFG